MLKNMDDTGAGTQTELSSRTAAVFSWLEFLGILIYLAVSFTLGRNHWLLLIAVMMLASGFFYKTYAAWKAGHKKTFWVRIALLVVFLIAAFLIGYYAGKKQ